MRTSAASAHQLCFPWISSAEVSPVRTSHRLARELALAVLEAASGVSSGAWSPSCGRRGLSSKMSPAARISGWTPSEATWRSSVMRAYRSRLRRQMSALRTVEAESSLLPTLTETGSLLAPSMQKWPAHRRLPTLTAQPYGSNRGGAAGRTGPARPSLQGVMGGRLNPDWCLWFMGFPKGWLDALDEPRSGCSATRLFHNAQRSLAG